MFTVLYQPVMLEGKGHYFWVCVGRGYLQSLYKIKITLFKNVKEFYTFTPMIIYKNINFEQN